jgi:phospholipid/cholesterol/gamma-HCH transport system substrate-binding protein
MAIVFGVLWVNFGGDIPGVTGGYRVTAVLADTQNLVYDSEVRIAGVSVGRIRDLQRTPEGVRVAMEIRGDAEPLHDGATVTLRAKTLIEETYLEVTDGTGAAIPGGGRLPASSEQLSVKFDDVVDSLDGDTRAALASAARRLGQATDGQAEAVSATLAALARLGRDGHDALDILAAQSEDLSGLVRETAALLAVLDEGEGQIARMVSAADRLTGAFASRDARLEETVRLLPGLLDKTRAASPPLRQLAGALTPLAAPFRQASPDLNAALAELPGATAELRALLGPLEGVLDRAPATLTRTPPAAADLSAAVPVLRAALADLNPMLAYLAPYGKDMGAFAANGAAVMNAIEPGGLAAGRFLSFFDQYSLREAGVPDAKQHNAYPPAGDASHPRDFSGPVPRVVEEPN